MGDLVMNWISQHQNIAWIASLILASGGVWAFLQKYSPKIRKALKVSQEVLELCNTVLDACDDKIINVEEVQKITKVIEDLQKVLK